MENINYIAWAVPFFALTVALEAGVSSIKEKGYYAFSDTISNLGCGIAQSTTDVFFKTILFVPYLYLYERTPVRWESAWVPWMLAFLGVDFFYYWWHRLAHRVNFIWAAHEVHHQSQEYNLSVALRQSVFGALTSWAFYLPLALLGVPPAAFIASAAFSLIYQYWIHTRWIKSLGVLEYVFNTPSHHRVHHATNPKYIDVNYAATLIVWDRMFGTFKQEEEEPSYGTVPPLKSWDPIWANFSGWVKLWKRAQALEGFDKVRLWFMPPEWKLGSIDPGLLGKYETPVPRARRYVVGAVFVATIALTMTFMLMFPTALFATLLLTLIWLTAKAVSPSEEKDARNTIAREMTISRASSLR